MVEREPPKWSWIIFADGNIAEILDTEILNKEGVEYRKMKIRPSNTMRFRMGIKEEELDRDGAIDYEVEEIMCKWIYPSAVNGRVFCLRDFKGRDLSYIFDEKGLRNQIVSLQRQLFAKNAEIEILHEEKSMIATQRMAWIAQENEIFKRLRKAGGMKREIEEKEGIEEEEE